MEVESNNIQDTFQRLRYEYAEVNQNFRHYSSLRFAILSVFFAIVGLLFSIAFGPINSTTYFSMLAKFGGLLITVVFFIFEHILNEYLRHFAKVAMELEELLGYRQFKSRPQFRVQTRHATYGLYILLLIFWVYALVWT
ncbi:MAG: hypothetical protein WHS87_02665 [Anaerolineales bacterium]